MSHGICRITSAEYKLRERDSYPLALSATVIPAFAGIHCARHPVPPGAIYQITYFPLNALLGLPAAGLFPR